MQRDLPKLPIEQSGKEFLTIYLDRLIMLAFTTIVSVYLLGTLLELSTGAYVFAPLGVTPDAPLVVHIIRWAYVSLSIAGAFAFYHAEPKGRRQLFLILTAIFLGILTGYLAGQAVNNWLAPYSFFVVFKESIIGTISILLVMIALPFGLVAIRQKGIYDPVSFTFLGAFLEVFLLLVLL